MSRTMPNGAKLGLLIVAVVSMVGLAFTPAAAAGTSPEDTDGATEENENPCNGAADEDCTCKSWHNFCDSGEKCNTYVYRACLDGREGDVGKYFETRPV